MNSKLNKSFKFINYVSAIFILFVSLQSQARDWQKIYIPGAECGDGSPYAIFYDQKSKSKLLIEFMGGGACWSKETCLGPNLRAWIRPIPEFPFFSLMSSEGFEHPWVNHSMIYFPYCTGDVHSGRHVGTYEDAKISHVGYDNVKKAFSYLFEQKIINFENLKDVTVWGASAGAIGSLVHAPTIESYLSENAVKTLIADSPGLHFGKNFWNKFSADLISDYQESFSNIDLNFPLDDGFLSPYLKPVFNRLKSWNIGIIQSTQDIVMSKLFGEISPEEHEKLVLSSQGLYAVSAGVKNVQVWIPRSKMHTFLLLPQSSRISDPSGLTALEFATRTYRISKRNHNK